MDRIEATDLAWEGLAPTWSPEIESGAYLPYSEGLESQNILLWLLLWSGLSQAQAVVLSITIGEHLP